MCRPTTPPVHGPQSAENEEPLQLETALHQCVPLPLCFDTIGGHCAEAQLVCQADDHAYDRSPSPLPSRSLTKLRSISSCRAGSSRRWLRLECLCTLLAVELPCLLHHMAKDFVMRVVEVLDDGDELAFAVQRTKKP